MQENVKIRIMRPEDYEGAYRLWKNTPGMGLNEADDSREGVRCFLRRNPRTCFVAVWKEEIVGTIMGGHDGRRGYLYHTAVDSRVQGEGIGSALLDAALEALKEEGITKAALVALAGNETGNQFWEKKGFFVRRDLHYRNKMLREVKEIHT